MDISSVLFDPELGCTAFTVERITCTRSREGTTSRSMTEQARGCIHPGTPEMLKLLPEEDRQETFIVIFTDYALSTGDPGDDGVSFDAPDRHQVFAQAVRDAQALYPDYQFQVTIDTDFAET